MDSTLSIPTPKTPRKNTSRDQRLRIHTLYFDAGWTQDTIALQLNLILNQVRYALTYRITPQKSCTGRKLLLNTPRRKQLINWVTVSKENQRVPWPEILALLG